MMTAIFSSSMRLLVLSRYWRAWLGLGLGLGFGLGYPNPNLGALEVLARLLAEGGRVDHAYGPTELVDALVEG